jgi:aminoglycoside phosphotransferase (APT) family kinase protein
MSDTASNPQSSYEFGEAIAAAIFRRYGVDFATVQRGGGWTNTVWLADELVLRLSAFRECDSLLREVRLAALLPPAVGYPAILESGMTDGFAWILARRVPGRSLDEVWSGLRWDERVVALHGLWERAEAVHRVQADKAAGIVSQRAWFNVTDAAEAETSLSRLTERGIFNATEGGVLRDVLNRFWAVLPAAPHVLCHGDLTPGNALWYEGQLVGLLDFEFAVLAPVQLDLNHLVKCAFGPVVPGSTNDADGGQRLRQMVQEVALPLLTVRGGRELLLGYAILLELWLLELWLAHPEGEGPLEQWMPLRRLRSLADGTGGYLISLLHH